MTQSPLLRRLCIRPPNPNKGQMTLNKKQTKTKKKKLNTVFMFLKTQNKNSNQTNFTIKKILTNCTDNKSDWCHFNNIINEYQN